MDEGFTCPPESGGGYYGSRAPGDAGDGGEVTDPGALPLRLKVIDQVRYCARGT